MRLTPEQLIIKVLNTAISHALSDYRQASCEHAAQKAKREVYEKMKDPMDGVGSGFHNPYNLETYEKREQTEKEKYEELCVAYSLAVNTFLRGDKE